MGCGWYGLALGRLLASKGFEVKGSTTSANKMTTIEANGIKPYLINFDTEGTESDADFFNTDVLFISIPPKVKSGGAHEYPARIQQIVNTVNASPVKHVIYISSTGVYGDNNKVVTELDFPGPTTESGKVLLAVEELLKAQTQFDTTIIRFGGLFGPERNAGRFFAGKKDIPNGQAPVNMIHLDDCIGLSQVILDKKAFGHTFNACSPQHPQKANFYTKAAETSGLPKPEFLDELNEWKQVDSVNVPQLLNYTFVHNLI